MSHPSRWALTRFWLGERAPLMGFFIALALTGILVGLFFVPISSPQALTSKVVGFYVAEMQTGSYPVARVVTQDGQVAIQLSRNYGCVVGSTINILRVYHIVGGTFTPSWPICSARTNHSVTAG